MTRALLFLCLLPAAGCVLYGGDDDCDYGGGNGSGAPIAPELLRNPETGGCEEFGYGGGGTVCGGGAAEAPDRAPDPDWGLCQSQCTGLDEGNCMATPGCQAAYVGECIPDAPCAPGQGLAFYECWQTAPQSTTSVGECWGLDAFSCSQHDNCVKVHWPAGSAGDQADPAPGLVQAAGPFEMCQPELIGCYGDAECGTGYTCTAEEQCLPPPGCGGPGPDGGGATPCPAVCYGYCVPDYDPAAHCYGEVACDALPPECPPDSRPGIVGACWSGDCIPLEQCPEGTCYGITLCDIVEPYCAEGSVPGVANGCYTGYCIPEYQCEDQLAACDTLGEVECIERTDCAPIYQGVDCTCAGDNCVCEDWLFELCDVAVVPF